MPFLRKLKKSLNENFDYRKYFIRLIKCKSMNLTTKKGFSNEVEEINAYRMMKND